MAVDLSEYTPVLRREVTPPGSDIFDAVGDEEFTGHLSDAFWEARLDGFLKRWETDPDGIVTPIKENGPDIPREMIALIVLYAGIKMLRNRLMNLNASFRAQAGPVEYEVRQSATVMAEMLRQLAETKKRLLEDVNVTPTCLVDGYTIRQISVGSYSGFYANLFHESFGPLIPVGD